MNDRDRVIVVGAGVIGLASAYYLERAGYGVTVIEKDVAGGACSAANCGYICPCHVLPLTEPGAVMMGLKSMFRPNSPFRIKPRLDPALWGWLLRFAARCRHDTMVEAGHALQALLNASMAGYRALMADEHLDCEWREDGLLYLLRSEAGLEAFGRTADLLDAEFGVRARRLDGPGLNEMDPGYRADLRGAFLYEGDASLRPERFTASLRTLLEERGVEILEHCPMRAVRKERGRLAALVTGRGELRGRHYVLATGAWSRQWQKDFEVRLPIQPGKGYSVTLDGHGGGPRYPALLPEHKVGISPLDDGLRVGSMMEFSGYDASIPARRLRLLYDSAAPYLAEPLPSTTRDTWYGWRPMTYDSLPVIGPAPRLDNVTLAVGHNMLGMTLAPATGRLVSEFVSGAEPHLDPRPYRPGRFN